MLAKLTLVAVADAAKTLERASHLLALAPNGLVPGEWPEQALLTAVQKRTSAKADELAKKPLSATRSQGGLICWAQVDLQRGRFEQLTAVRKALAGLLQEKPKALTVLVAGDREERSALARLVAYVAWVNGVALPALKKKPEDKPLQQLQILGAPEDLDLSAEAALAEGLCLTRELTLLPPNDLNPAAYRTRVKKLAAKEGWEHREYDMEALRTLGAGAFVAVGQGSDPQDAAIVHLKYRPKKARAKLALVGKGICFDTGGHNLKPARYMHNMHEDMNGSAVALGILAAASRQRLPVALDVWLAIAQNHISPKAYKQNDVVRALNGTFIEIIHTDAEGRMVLADTLTLAARAKPDVLVDFATLTGSCATALGSRYSGLFSNREDLASWAVGLGKTSGDRLCWFPTDEDYDSPLDSSIADVKQCIMAGDADHILAARFLGRFVEERPWLHVDLSASRCEGGLAAVASDITGFGVGWGVALLRHVAAEGMPK